MGTRLIREGEEDHVVILSRLTESQVWEKGAKRMVARRDPGHLIDEWAALEVFIRSATVVAIQTVIALIMRTADHAASVSTYPTVFKILNNQIYARLREASARYTHGQCPGLAEGVTTGTPERASNWKVMRTPLLIGQNCTVVRTDVVAFGADDRDDQARWIIRRATSEMTRLALGSAWDMRRWEDRGDGLLLVVFPDIPTAHVIDRLMTVLPQELRLHNRLHDASARIQLRVAVEVGPVEEDDIGISGYSIIQVSRMLDAAAFKQAIFNTGALLGLIVSPFVYESYVRTGGHVLDRADYAQVPVHVKENQGSAWMHLTGAAAPTLEELIPRRRG